MKEAVEPKAVQTKREREKRRGRRGVAWLLSLCLIFTLCPVGQAATVAELTAQLEATRAELASVKSQLATDYPNCVSVNGQVVSQNPLVVKTILGDYYMVKNPEADSYTLFGTWYNNYHELTGNTSVVYDNGIAHNATVVGAGYPKAKQLNYRRLELEKQETELDSELDDKKRLTPILERGKILNENLESLMCVRGAGIRLIFKVGNPFMMICGEKRECVLDLQDGAAWKIDGKQVFEREPINGWSKLKDYGAFIEDENLNAMPVVIDGSTMIPVRPLVEWLGGTVNWDSQTNAINCQLDGVTLSMTIDSSTAYVNGEAKEMPVPVTVYGGKTVIPLRFAAENLGYRVEWLQEGQYIRIYDKEETVTPPTAEVTQQPQYDWSNFAGDWVCEEEQYRLHIPDGGDNQTSTGTFRCDGWLGEFSVTFVLEDDETVSVHEGWVLDCILQPDAGGLLGTGTFLKTNIDFFPVNTAHFVPAGD